jgi:RHS repeat-associated protein
VSDRCFNAKARYFDPQIGRFTSQDSFLGQIDDPPSLHRYFYANDNPTRFIDSTGHYSQEMSERGQGVAQELHQIFRSVQTSHKASERSETYNRWLNWSTQKLPDYLPPLTMYQGLARQASDDSEIRRLGGMELGVGAVESAITATVGLVVGKAVGAGRAALNTWGASNAAGTAAEWLFKPRYIGGVPLDPINPLGLGNPGIPALPLPPPNAPTAGVKAEPNATAEPSIPSMQPAVPPVGSSGAAAGGSPAGLMDLPDPPTHVRVSQRGDAIYYLDAQGLPVRSDVRIEGPHPGRGKGYRPDPVGGRAPGHHRGHLAPENLVANPADVNVQENIISEAAPSNLGRKRVFENQAGRTAAAAGGETRFVSDPIRDAGQTVPKAVTHYVTQDGKVVDAQTILNKDKP